MLGDYFYHQIFRKSILAFGTVFNNIIVKRKQPGVKVPTGKNAIEAYKVPIQYGPYQKYLAMIAAEPNPERQAVQISLPRMSFEIKALTYDGSRKMTPTTFARTVPQSPDPESGKPVQYSQFLPVPYNLEVELNILSKNQDDGLQIIEQILPNFHPSLNVSIEVIDVFVAILALGAAKGKLSFFNKLLVIGCFGNLTAKVFFLLVTILEIFEFFFKSKINVRGPGQNFL